MRRAFDEFRPDAVLLEVPSSLGGLWAKAVERLPRISMILVDEGSDAARYLAVHPADPLAEAARLARERGIPAACGDLDTGDYADWRDPVPDPYALFRLGPEALEEAWRRVPRPRDPWDDRREAALAWHGRRLREQGATRLLAVCGLHHADGLRAALQRPQAEPLTPPAHPAARLVHLHPDSLGEVLEEVPFYVAAYEARRSGAAPEEPQAPPAPAGRDYGPFRVLSGGRGDDPARVRHAVARAARGSGPIDRLRLQWALLREAEAAVAASAPGERVEAWQRRNLARFTRNLARLSGRLLVDLFDLLAAARACVSDNYAWELHRLASAYPPQDEAATDLPTARIRADQVYAGTRRLRLVRRHRRPKQRGLESLLRRRRRDESFPGEWLAEFDPHALCSYPPEDLVIEEFGRHLKKRGMGLLSEERSRTVPFTTSVLDGIDVRETIRHRPEGRLYVRELGRSPGEVGPVVVIFEDEPLDGTAYPYTLTWLGEHAQESDMAFYATDPARAIVGPGICRATYGGLMLSYPPGRLMDVWTDADYRFAETKAEVLLLAALDYATERVVVHVAARPPRTVFATLAARLDRRILHVPLGTLSPSTLKRIRVLHILGGHDKRTVAKDFVW